MKHQRWETQTVQPNRHSTLILQLKIGTKQFFKVTCSEQQKAKMKTVTRKSAEPHPNLKASHSLANMS